MISTEINLPRKLTNQLLHLAQLSPEAEICGLIGANQAGIPSSCYPVDNSATNPDNRFLMDAGQQINALRAIREKSETLFGIYHSHPHAPAIPSATDLELASYPEAVQLIISLNTKGVLEIRAYRINAKTAQEIKLNLIEI
ncbi:M67 family metallopeptidase [Methylomonas paludis]|uniref:M67 family metallopeptidase n=1 Tax=Methylomonas paludis TaxID=1173101 RepID=A0A975R8R8_9GAMM|nr:M67 family metallopeptidase [Methylomonas paludis]QWF70307.1 M67 family metallopeptidase [Methylomonas paludis]